MTAPSCRCRALEDALDDAGETIAALRAEVAELEDRLHAEHLARVNAQTERDAAHGEVARLLDRADWGSSVRVWKP